MSGTLGRDGILRLAFEYGEELAEQVEVDVKVSDSGEMCASSSTVGFDEDRCGERARTDVEGTFNFDDCSATGTWTDDDEVANWTLAR